MRRSIIKMVRRALTRRSIVIECRPRPLAERPEAILRPSFNRALCSLLIEASRSGRPLTFVQVGAFDGVANDPIFNCTERFMVHGLLIEPQPEAFAKLLENYRGRPGLTFENVAIDRSSGSRTLYRVKPGALGDHKWAYQIASFDPTVISKHRSRLPGLDAAIEGLEVQCETLNRLMERHNLHRIDLLLIDAEGYDLEILRSANLPAIQPTLVRYEHQHLTPADAESALRILIDSGYKVCVEGPDTFGLRDRDLPS